MTIQNATSYVIEAYIFLSAEEIGSARIELGRTGQIDCRPGIYELRCLHSDSGGVLAKKDDCDCRGNYRLKIDNGNYVIVELN